MVHTEQVQHSGVEIVYLQFVFHHVIAEFVGGPESRATLDSTPRHPEGKAPRMVVSAITALCKWGTTKLACPNDKGFFQKAALLQVLEQGADGLIHGSRVLGMTVS